MNLTNVHANPRGASRELLLQPFQLGHLRLKNRIVSTSHAISYDVEGLPLERYQRYHEEKARGGLAMTMFGGSANISPDSASVFGQLVVGSDEVIPKFQEFSDRIHRYDCKIMCQLTHLGRRTTAYGDNWLTPIAPSRVREKLHRSFPREMDDHDIMRVVRNFGDAAWRCKEGGLDGCEVMVSSHLIGQFLSPFTNLRRDRFGGSLSNRMRFGLMVLNEIRERVGDKFVVSLRMPAHEGGEGGLVFDEAVEVAQTFEAEGLVDLFNLTYGRMDTELALATQNMPGMSEPIGPFLPTIKAFRAELQSPVLHAARIVDVATARHALASESVDLVGMTRAHIADPHIVNKLSIGLEDRIRPCIGASMCLSSRRACLHNPATGREEFLSHTVVPSHAAPKQILVIGGGPAGLEAARVSALRGHRVTLIEASNELGGQIGIARRATSRADLQSIIGWLKGEIEALNIAVRFNFFVEAEDVMELQPDVVVLATGGLPSFEHIQGSELCMSTWDVLSAPSPERRSAIVYDELGFLAAASCAETLAENGTKVTLVTPHSAVAIDAGYPERVVMLKKLYELNVEILVDHELISVERDGTQRKLKIVNTLTSNEISLTSETVIIEAGTIPDEELFNDLKGLSVNNGVLDVDCLSGGHEQPWETSPGKFELYRVGDATASSDIHSALFEATRLARGF